MTQTGWIIAGVVVLLAIIVLSSFLRRKPEEETPAAPPRPVPAPPQTVAAEESVARPAPVAAPPPVEAAPAPVVTPEPAPLSPSPVTLDAQESDDLLKLKGVGPKIAAVLKAEGITRYAQIAAWTTADITAIDAKLGSFAGRPVRDNWVEQAGLLAAGDTAGYEAKYGKL